MNQEQIGRLLHMISYRKLWKTMKERKISQYALYTHYGISTSFLDKLRHNENVEIRSLDILCSILDCDFGDIVEPFRIMLNLRKNNFFGFSINMM